MEPITLIGIILIIGGTLCLRYGISLKKDIEYSFLDMEVMIKVYSFLLGPISIHEGFKCVNSTNITIIVILATLLARWYIDNRLKPMFFHQNGRRI